jgi:hypothetical protein
VRPARELWRHEHRHDRLPDQPEPIRRNKLQV